MERMKAKTKTVSLGTALSLIKTTRDDDIVYLQDAHGDACNGRPNQILPLHELRRRYDMKKTRVMLVQPYFQCGGLSGMLLTISVAGHEG